jgi:uncharacterized protein
MPIHIDVPRHRLAEFCRRHQIQTLSLFGSVLREDFRPDSDIDVLVEFEGGHAPGLLGIARVERELSEILGGVSATFSSMSGTVMEADGSAQCFPHEAPSLPFRPPRLTALGPLAAQPP